MKVLIFQKATFL